jgi:drug/metabolite transporter superfamily protein YnfA
MLSGFLVAGAVTVLAALITFARTDIRCWLGYSNFVDITFTIMLITLFSGSFGGVVAAAFAGMFMSLALTMLRATLGCKKLKFVRGKWYKGGVKLAWVYIAPEPMLTILKRRFKRNAI